MKFFQVDKQAWLDLDKGFVISWDEEKYAFVFQINSKEYVLVSEDYALNVMRMLSKPDNYVFKPDFSGLPEELQENFSDFMAQAIGGWAK